MLESDEITPHLQAGKFVTKIAIDWENHFSCVLNEEAINFLALNLPMKFARKMTIF